MSSNALMLPLLIRCQIFRGKIPQKWRAQTSRDDHTRHRSFRRTSNPNTVNDRTRQRERKQGRNINTMAAMASPCSRRQTGQRLQRAMASMFSFGFALCCVSSSLAANTAFVGPRLLHTSIVRHYSDSVNRGGLTSSGRLCMAASNGADETNSHDMECKVEMESMDSSPDDGTHQNTRRQFFQQQILATTFIPTISQAATDLSSTMDNGYFSLRNNNNIPYAQRQQLISQQKSQEKERAEKRKRNTYSFKTKKWTPFVNVNKWNSAETCLLEMLPVKNPVFRQLQELIQDLEVYPSTDSEGWKQTLLDSLALLSLLDSKRSILEPIYNQEDPTLLYISKSALGERNIEVLRSKLEDLINIASGDIDLVPQTRSTVNAGIQDGKSGKRDKRRGKPRNNRKEESNIADDIDMDLAGEISVDAFIKTKRRALLSLSELGELLVPSFPYAVPTRGKFGYLPRLLGRCSVTLSFERPSVASQAFGVNFGAISGNTFLGNVTIIADGYAAPITAGNFVDLSVRNFYNGLPVKAMRKRLGVVPTLSDNIIVNGE